MGNGEAIEVDHAVAVVRAFNRTVTRRIGALSDEYLQRGRPLGASRVLWELAPDGTDLRSLRARLDLDSGYCSRLVRSLQDEGLVEVVPDADDGRVRIARPTAAGRREQALLDAGSDDLARDLLAPLGADQRGRLVAAMQTVERLLTAGLVEITVEDPTSPAARHCLAAYYAELDQRMATGYDPDRALPITPAQMTPPHGLLLVARLGGEPVGCGALRFSPATADPATVGDRGDGADHRVAAEVKRVWIDPATRGLGLGRRLMGLLEDQARAHGVEVLRLDTNAALVEAVGLYRALGWREVAAFNDEPHADHWFAKSLADVTSTPWVG